MSSERYTLRVEGMSCEHCKNAVEKAVGALSGVMTAKVDLPTDTLFVVFDTSKITLEQIKEVVDEEGYTVVDNK